MPQETVVIHNKLSPNYRQLHVDGGFGGLTTRGLINLSFFAERLPVPKSTDFKLNKDGTVGELIANSSDSKTGIIREFEFGIYMDLNTAKNIAEFLMAKVADLEKILNTQVENNPSKQ